MQSALALHPTGACRSTLTATAGEKTSETHGIALAETTPVCRSTGPMQGCGVLREAELWWGRRWTQLKAVAV